METQIAVHEKKMLTTVFSEKYGIEPNKMLDVLRATAFRQSDGKVISNEQLAALMIVSNQYNLNPFTKEIYAFPAKGGGIVPVVGIDGWLRVINEHPKFDGMDISSTKESCTVTIYRKDRTHAISVTEILSECKRSTEPWNTCPTRMLRHKAIMQCARVALSLTGIVDEDDAYAVHRAENTPPLARPEPQEAVVVGTVTTPPPAPAAPAPEKPKRTTKPKPAEVVETVNEETGLITETTAQEVEQDPEPLPPIAQPDNYDLPDLF
jgi:phage recombination protein Bet